MKRFYNCQSVAAVLLLVLTASCQRSAQFYLDRGDRLFNQEKYEEAAISYRKSIQRNAQDAQGHYRLALTELKVAHPVDAYQALTRATQLAPNRRDIQIELADLALGLYSLNPRKPKFLYDQALTVADALSRENAGSFDALRLRGTIFTLDGRWDDALAAFRKAESMKPLDRRIRLAMVQVLLQLRQVAEAENSAQEFIKDHSDFGAMYDVLLGEYARTNRTSDEESLLKRKVTNIPKEPAPSMQLASFYRSLHRDQEMNQALQKILSRPQDFPQGHGLVGDFYAETGAWDAAIREYEAGIARGKDTRFYQKKIVKVLIAQGKREGAIKQLNDELKSFPDDSDARIARAILLRESNDAKSLDFAISEMNAILVKNPNDEVVHYNLGLAYMSKTDTASARSQFLESARLRKDYLPPTLALAELEQKTGNYAETVRLANAALSFDPSNVDARLWHAAGLVGTKVYGQARRELDALVREYPDSLNVNLHLAVLDTIEKRYRDAEARYLKFYKPGQQDLRPLEGLVQLRLSEKQIDGALKLLDQEVKLSPGSPAVHLLLAATAVRTGKLDLATEQYEWLRSNEPKSVWAYASLGDVYQLKGDLNSALTSYKKARDLSPSDSRIGAMVAFLEIGSGQNSEAIATLKKQIASDPENVIALNNLAYALAESGTDLDQALSFAEKAQRKVPNNAGVSDTLAWVYSKKGLNDSAIQIFNRLVKKYPDEAAFRYHLGVALLQKGQPAEAKAEFVISLSKNPPKDMAERIKQILSKLG
jgi:tetratricopeptide (TPR) repeat protein